MDFADQDIRYILFLPGVFPDTCDDVENELKVAMNEDIPLSEIENDDSSDESFNEKVNEETTLESINISDLYSKFIHVDPALGNNKIDYDELPEFFIDVDRWPKKCNLLCRSCKNTPRDMPWPIIISKIKMLVSIGEGGQIYFKNSELDNEECDIDTFRQKELKEIKVHEYVGMFCHPFCARYYIDNVNDAKITNKWEAIHFLVNLYNQVNHTSFDDIPLSEDPMLQMQFSGKNGITSHQFICGNELKETRLKQKI
jgi:hypothetical protein